MLRVSVSNLDLYRQYREDEDYPLGLLIQQLRGEAERTPAMMRGGAFAKAMEQVGLGDSNTISAEGHTFTFTCDAEIEFWPRREEKGEKDYGGITVTARCDRIMGHTIKDDKTTAKFDAEAYQDKVQWRYYLDIFGADMFQWHVWECKELDTPTSWEVYDHHLLTQYRYPDLERDCRELAVDFCDFIIKNGLEATLERPARGTPSEGRKPQQEPVASRQTPWYGVTDPNGQLLAVSYEPEGGLLGVRWKKGEGVHSEVPEEIFVTIRRVPFAYSYYQNKVKGQYPYRKVE